jgi:hypothetical protein
MDNHIRHPEAERSDNTEPQSHLRLLNSREQVKWSASIMLSLNWRNQAIERFDRWSLSAIAICTKPLARRTLPHVRKSAVMEGLRD